MDYTPIISFCHFCEIHGPSTVFSTQSFIESSTSIEFNEEKDLKVCEGCSITPKSLICKKYDGEKQIAQLYKGYVTNDLIMGRKYITADEPLCYRSLIKQACVRSLSCETYPQEKEGAIYFGDDIRWHNLSWLFVLKDSRARGFNRTYSIVISHPNKPYLMSSWTFYNKYVNQIIDNLKLKSAQIFKKEIATMDCKHQRWSIRLDRVSQFGYPSNMNSNLMNRLARYNNQPGSSSSKTIQPNDGDSDTTTTINQLSKQHRDASNTQRGNSEARSLIDLTADELIFANLHLLFCHILKSMTERFMQLSPQYEVDRLSSSKINTKTNNNNNNQDRSTTPIKHLINENTTTELKHEQVINTQQQQQQQLEDDQSDVLSRSSQILHLDKIHLGDNLSCWQDAKYFTSLRHMYMFLGRDKFKIIGYHTIIGSKIVIICKYRVLLFEFMKCLAMLLPIDRHQQQVTKQETSSVDSWKLNIIGVVGNKLPNNILESNHQLLVDISERNTTTLEHMSNMRLLTSIWPHNSRIQATTQSLSTRNTTKTLGLASNAFKVTPSNYRVTLHSKEKTPSKLPQFLTNLMEIIRNVFYSDQCLERYLIATKEEWLTNAKMVWAITRKDNLAVVERNDPNLSQIYHLFNIEDCDRKLIQYWADADTTFKMNAIQLF